MKFRFESGDDFGLAILPGGEIAGIGERTEVCEQIRCLKQEVDGIRADPNATRLRGHEGIFEHVCELNREADPHDSCGTLDGVRGPHQRFDSSRVAGIGFVLDEPRTQCGGVSAHFLAKQFEHRGFDCDHRTRSRKEWNKRSSSRSPIARPSRLKTPRVSRAEERASVGGMAARSTSGTR